MIKSLISTPVLHYRPCLQAELARVAIREGSGRRKIKTGNIITIST
jgi:hypothetical protein